MNTYRLMRNEQGNAKLATIIKVEYDRDDRAAYALSLMAKIIREAFEKKVSI